jgi:cell division transport system ATP-binding protein
MKEDYIIQMFQVWKRYPPQITALQDINIRIKRGEFVFLVGPSGAGKTTFLHLIFAYEMPTSGEILVAGRSINHLPRHLIPYLRRQIGVVFQDFKLLYSKTVFENVAFALEVRGLPRSEINRRTINALGRVGLIKRKDLFPHQISGGEQQRVAIARAIVGRPEILLADEPTGNLDPTLEEEILSHLNRINKEGVTIVVATHNLNMASRVDGRVIKIEGGRVIDESP